MFRLLNAAREYPKYYERWYQTFNFYDGEDAWLDSIKDIPRPAVHLFCIHWLHLEVYNGGFAQYFWNSTGTSAPEAIEGFEAIGMSDVANIVSDACNEIAEPFPRDKLARESILKSPFGDEHPQLRELDGQFYDLADTDQTFFKLPKFASFADQYARDCVAQGLLTQPDA